MCQSSKKNGDVLRLKPSAQALLLLTDTPDFVWHSLIGNGN